MGNDAGENQYDREHVALWVRWLTARGLDRVAIMAELDQWTQDGVSQIYVGQYARTMPSILAKAMVEHALAVSG
jgi:hypothetical protein